MAYSLSLFFPAKYTRLAGPKAPGDFVPASHLALRLQTSLLLYLVLTCVQGI